MNIMMEKSRKIHPHAAGIDIGSEKVFVAVEGLEVSNYRTFTIDFGRLVADLVANGVETVAMEATGVYWKPVWHVLEDEFELVLANAAHIRNVPGRKTDVNDAMWIADLLAHGLIRSSFVPPQAIQQLRDLTRTRKQLVREVSQHSLRIQKVLEDANLKLGSVLSDVLGKSGRAMLDAIVAGETDPTCLAALAQGTARNKTAELREALRGRITDHHRTMLRLHLQVVDALQRTLAELDAAVGKALAPIQQRARLLTTMPGISDLTASVVVAEIGVDMSRFPTAGHLVSWAGLCPRSDESAGKRRSTRVRKSGTWIKTTLVTAAWAAVRVKTSYLRAQFLRIKARRGAKKAILAVAASMLTAAFHMLRDGTEYNDLGSEYFDRQDKSKTIRRLLKRLQDLGCDVPELAHTV